LAIHEKPGSKNYEVRERGERAACCNATIAVYYSGRLGRKRSPCPPSDRYIGRGVVLRKHLLDNTNGSGRSLDHVNDVVSLLDLRRKFLEAHEQGEGRLA
jgi:hypothetical protein